MRLRPVPSDDGRMNRRMTFGISEVGGHRYMEAPWVERHARGAHRGMLDEEACLLPKVGQRLAVHVLLGLRFERSRRGPLHDPGCPPSHDALDLRRGSFRGHRDEHAPGCVERDGYGLAAASAAYHRVADERAAEVDLALLAHRAGLRRAISTMLAASSLSCSSVRPSSARSARLRSRRMIRCTSSLCSQSTIAWPVSMIFSRFTAALFSCPRSATWYGAGFSCTRLGSTSRLSASDVVTVLAARSS